MALNVQSSNDGSQLDFVSGGFRITDINRSGELSFWKLAEHFQFNRQMMVTSGNNLSINGRSIFEEGVVFLVLGVYNLSPKIYAQARKCLREPFWFKHSCKLHSLGKSTFELISSIHDETSGDFLASFIFKYVFVNRETRKSQPLPRWFIEKFSGIAQGKNLAPFKLGNKPADQSKLYHKRHVVVASDLDFNQHVNNTVYFRFCFDIASEASMKRALFPCLPGDVCQYHVKRSTCSYVKERRLDDVLEICVWESPQDPHCLHFEITNGQALSFVATIEFAPTIFSSNL